MGFLKKVATVLGGVVGGTFANMLLGDKKKKAAPTAPVPTPNRNLAAEKAAQSDLLAKRRGVVANMVLGARGAEAGTGSGTKLGG